MGLLERWDENITNWYGRNSRSIVSKIWHIRIKNIEIIKDCCEYANLPYPKAHKVNFDDDKVWEDMIKYPYGIFQFESKYANELLSKFKPHKINDMNLVNASLRPSGESYRDKLLAGILIKSL